MKTSLFNWTVWSNCIPVISASRMGDNKGKYAKDDQENMYSKTKKDGNLESQFSTCFSA